MLSTCLFNYARAKEALSRGVAFADIVKMETRDKISIKIVPTSEYTQEEEGRILRDTKSLIGEDMEVTVTLATDIHSTMSLKKRFVVSNLGSEYLEKELERQ